MAATSVHHTNSAPESNTAAWVGGLLLPVAIYIAFWVLNLSPVAAVGFCVIVPSIIGSTLATIVNAGRATS